MKFRKMKNGDVGYTDHAATITLTEGVTIEVTVSKCRDGSACLMVSGKVPGEAYDPVTHNITHAQADAIIAGK